MPSVPESFFGFLGSVSAIGTSLLHALLAVVQATLGLGQELVTSIIRLVQALVELVINLAQSVAGFVLANFFVIAILGGGYYWYTKSKQGLGGHRKGLQVKGT